ncbi:MAG: polysaccharide biosynthesis/export family protein, partial [Candidatus Dormibacteraceae bacterium]
VILTALSWSWALAGLAQTADRPSDPASIFRRPLSDSGAVVIASPQYVLHPGDVVHVMVYQEDDLTSISRIGKDGTMTMPLVGSVKVVSNTLASATIIIRDLLAKDYLVNPQVTMNVTEFAKRRFTVLGQVQRPGTFEMPGDEPVSLLQAIATAGGYTRIGNARKISVQRSIGGENKLLQMDAEAMAVDKNRKPFEVLPDDVIVVGEKWL